MSDKTLGQIGFEAMQAHEGITWWTWDRSDRKENWEAAASAIRNAVLEEAAKKMVELSKRQFSHTRDEMQAEREDAKSSAYENAADELRALKHGD
jgi:hypothetical protein